ncbi:putative methyltransferase-domain-containing protein [Thelephora terrestris]|uniref:Methyltransferase-domain-containing protein n=1 Tax=Thelephora terrestris TaxID=56493 RepID=A0A9P6L195_9AGAM|nr:putative methyltransferase-domain-containing protein [Thelephora terrestris]
MTPITLSSNPGSTFTYTNESATLHLKTPDTKSENWSLHASSVWISAVFLGDHIHLLDLDRYHHLPKTRVLELGAGAGLPGILIAKTRDDVQVVLSDYPDEELIDALNQNVAANVSNGSVHVVPYDWTTGDTTPFRALSPDGFDVIIAADTLWNVDLHGAFLQSLESLLRRDTDGPSTPSINLVAGLHTGRWTIQAFLRAVEDRRRFLLHRVVEIRANSGKGTTLEERNWQVEREGEDESGRRAWVVSITIGWK